MYSIIFQASPIFQSWDTLINKKVVHLIKTNGGSNLDMKQSGGKGEDGPRETNMQTKKQPKTPRCIFSHEKVKNPPRLEIREKYPASWSQH